MKNWKATALAEIHRLALAGCIVITDKARRELDHLRKREIDEEDVCDILLALLVEDLVQRLWSTIAPNGSMSSRSTCTA